VLLRLLPNGAEGLAVGFKSPDRKKFDQLLAAKRAREDPGTDIIQEFGAGLATGFKRDPFVAAAIKGLRGIDGADPDGLTELERRVQNTTAAQAGRIIGEFGPGLLFGVGAYGGGFLAGRAAIRAIAKKAGMRDAVRASLKGIGRPITRSELSAGAIKPQRGFLKTSLDRTARKADDVPGVRSPIQGTPLVQAAAERTGAASGIGSFVSAQELARGKSPSEALKTGGLAAALSLGIDTALVGGTRLLFRGSRSVDVAAIKKNAEQKAVNIKRQQQIDRESTNIQKITDKLRGVLKVDNQQRELEFFHGARAARSKEILATPEAKDLVRTLRAAKSRKRAAELVQESEGVNPYLGQGPGSAPTPMARLLNRVDKTGGLRAAWTKLVVAPERGFGAEGEAANKFFTVLKNELTASIKEEEILLSTFSNWGKVVMRAIGTTPREFRRGTGRNLDIAHEWERIGGGPEAVKKLMQSWGRSADDAEQVIAAFENREALDKSIYLVRGKGIGAQFEMDLEKAGVGRWLTHASRDIPIDEQVKEMVKSGNFTEAQAYKLVRARGSHMDPTPVSPEGIQTNGPVRNGPLEYNRVETGTTRDKIQRGLPLNPNVWDSGYETARSAVRRIHTDPILGGAVNTEKGRVLGGSVDDIVALVEAEGGSGIKVRATIDALAGRTYYDESMRKWASALTSIQTAAKLPMAFLGNSTQAVLTTTWLGYKASLSGMFKLANKEQRVHLQQAMNLHEHIVQALGHSLDQEGLVLTSLEKFADYVLRFTGFSAIESFNRIHGAAATQAMIRDRLARGSADKLRGIRLDTTRRMFGDIGLDFDGMVLQLREEGPEAFFRNQRYLDQEFNAMIQGAQKTQFFPGPTRTPPMWKHPLARTMLQFKTFAVGQSRLIRDAVLTEYAHGNMAPLATYLSAAPIAGEFVGDAKALIRNKDRPESGILRGLHNLSYIGGLGFVTDVYQVAQWGKMESIVLGPTFSDFFQFSEYTLTGEWDQLRKMAQRQPIVQLGGFLSGSVGETAGLLAEYIDFYSGDDDTTTRIDIGQRLTDRIQNKGGGR